jgi:uncharacterized membrane protein YkvA (DUF1232 family)
MSDQKTSLTKKLRRLAREFKHELAVYRRVLKHPDTPAPAKMLLGLAAGYVVMPFDLIPDFIPVLGQLDDLIIVPGLVWMALKQTPAHVIEECRQPVAPDS